MWLMADVDDWIRCDKFSANDITVNALQTGPRSISDVALTQMALHDYLLGMWMDSQSYSPPRTCRASALRCSIG